MSEQSTLSGILGQDEPGECAHDDVAVWPVPSDMHFTEDHEWRGKHPIWCRSCSDFVDRVLPDDLERKGYVRS